MAIIKCKMCGGDLEVVAESRVAVCEYCGTQQTVPSADNEKKLTLFGRANRLRMACEFDKAAGVYESIVADFPEEAEAYWGLVLCKFGIEYVDDPATGKKIPTCHRSSFDSVMDDSNLEQALDNADAIARRVYRDEAKAIEDLRKGIIEVSGKEDPYDIFICYKETDDNGDRTIDSVIAQEVYDALTEKGYRVFFSRITLEDKLGQEYEPYIFAALHSAKIMLAFGTDYEYYNAVWVKNEWSRFLQLIAAGEKKTLIPCYKNIDAYDMPKEFARLQAQDMGKVGAMQDLLRGIEKILPREKAVVKETVVVQQSAETTKVQAMLERAFLFLEDGDWNAANEYCEKALDIDPKCAEAYLGKLMVDLKVTKREELKNCAEPFDEKANYVKAIRFADDNLRITLTGIIDSINTRNENARLEDIYSHAKEAMESASTEETYREAADMFTSISEYKDSIVLAKVCYEREREERTQKVYLSAKQKMKIKTVDSIKSAIDEFTSVISWKDSEELLQQCHRLLEDCEKDAKYYAAIKEGNTKGANSASVLAPVETYALMAKDLEKVIADLSSLNGWRDSEQKIQEYKRQIAELTEISENFATVQTYRFAKAKMESKQTESIKVAIEKFKTILEWKDSEALLQHCYVLLEEREKDNKYYSAINLADSKRNVSVLASIEMYAVAREVLKEAIGILKPLNGWRDSEQKVKEYEKQIVELQQKEIALQEARKIQEEKQRIERKKTWRSTGKCQHCGGAFKGLFSKKCTSCGKEKDY